MVLWRTWMPRPYPMQEMGQHGSATRSLWHLEDHVDPRNITALRRILEAFRPDMVVVHLLVGLGWNVLGELGRRDIPVLVALHDLVLACIRSAMFRNGHACKRQCADCVLSAAWKRRMMSKVPRLGFYSPSASNLHRLEQHVALGARIRRICPNPIAYLPTIAMDRPATGPLRLLFVGRLHPSKGLHVLLEAAERLDTSSGFTLHVAGDGAQMDSLRERYGHHEWVTFHGYVGQSEVAALMGASHVLCVPSIWNENAPGVIVQALGAGLPVLGSNTGGIPELIGTSGAGNLVAPGDSEAWRQALATLVHDRSGLAEMGRQARRRASIFEPDHAGAELYRLMLDVRAGASSKDTTNGK